PGTKPNLAIIKQHERHLEEKMDELVKTALDTKRLIIAAEE
ncbi:MAG: tRNA 4-thiouridine(8) synthase ThiI, partial [Lachnospiraceae bacterium]|nr:tRNA 4-thiouridine(8) synthase ThiI [Lachnospiraceae bacterium]